MSLRLFLFCVNLLTCTGYQISLWVKPPAYYHVIAPGTIQSNSDYPISVSLTESQSHKMWWFWMVLWAKADEIYMTAAADDIQVYPGTTTLSRFSKIDLHHREGRVTMSHNGSTLSMTPLGSPINIENRSYSVYIQTDKAKYKPGDVVQFRVIFLDRSTRPVNVTNDDIFVQFYDGLGNMIKEFSNVVSVQGVYKGYLQISDYPALGEWKIDVKSGMHDLRKKSFQVARGTELRFTFNFTPDTEVTIGSDKLRYSYEGRYSDGSVVQGNFTIQLNVTYSAFDHYYSNYTLQTDNPLGKTELSLQRDFNFTRDSSEKRSVILYKISAMARVQENLFGFSSEVRTEIVIHNNPFRIKIDVPRIFDPEELVKLWVYLHPIGPFESLPRTHFIRLRFEGTALADASRPQVANLKFVTMYCPESSAVVSVNLTNDGWREYKVEAEFFGWISESQTFRKRADTVFKLDVLTERPQVGEELVVQLRSKDPIDYFVYHILSSVDILQFGRVNVTGDANTYSLHISTTDAMLPKITVYIHSIQKGVLYSTLKEIYIKRVLYNGIQISVDNEKYGHVAINVKTNEGSYVGLLAVPQEHLLMENKYHDQVEENFFTVLHNFDSLDMDSKRYPASEAGLLVFTNARRKADSGNLWRVLREETENTTDQPLPARITQPTFQLPAVQEVFSESWMFKDFESTPAEGLQLLDTIPNPAAHWVLIGFSLNPITGLTFTKTPIQFDQKMRLFMELPNLVRKGEIIAMPVYMINDGRRFMTVIMIARTSGLRIESLDKPDSRIDTMKNIEIDIPPKHIGTCEFIIRSQATGVFNVTAKASFYETVFKERTITVIPEGISMSHSRRYCRNVFKPLNDYKRSAYDGFQNVVLETPQNAIDGSVTLHVTILRDVFQLLTRRLEEQVDVPIGNCKDTLRYMMANILMLKYMKVQKNSNSDLQTKAKLHLEQAYQNLMAFRHSDGSFSLFNQNAITPDIWLTTFALWVLDEASHFIVVDPSIIQQGFENIYRKQIQSQNFSSGTGTKDDILFTAFAFVSFLQNDTRRQYLNETLAYLQEVQDTAEDTLSTVMSTYAMALDENATFEDVLDQLTNITQTFRAKTYISLDRDSLQAELEATAEFFITLLDNRTNHTLLPIVKALLSIEQDERIPNYLLALDAMIKIAEDTNSHNQTQDLRIKIEDMAGSFRDVSVTHTPHTIKLSPSAGQLRLSNNGFGFGILDFRWNYRICSQNQSLASFKTNVTFEDPTIRRYVLKICTARKSPSTQGILSRIEVNLQSGFAFHEDSFERGFQIKSIQLNGHYSSVLVYVQDIFENGTCIQLECLRYWHVYDAKPGSITVYDEHKEDNKSIIFFHIPEKTTLHK